jgi:hypothetical protein
MVPLKAAVTVSAEGGGTCPLDFGSLGTAIPRFLFLTNKGFVPSTITDAHTLGAPFAWRTGGAFPGGTGTALVNGGHFQFCSGSLAVGDTCVVAVTYQPGTEGSSKLTLDISDSYDPQVSCALTGASTSRALLTVSEFAGFFDCTDATCAPVGLSCSAGASALTTLVVSNRGGAPAVTLGPGSALSPPFVWGTKAASAPFPGGSGRATVWGVDLPYCGATLDVGAQCIVTVGFFPTAAGPAVTTSVDLAYADADGPLAADARRTLVGQVATLPP